MAADTDLLPGQIQFRVHGPQPTDDSQEVSAAVFAAKLGTLVRALKAADKAANGRVVHDYTIAKLKSSSPTAILNERLLPTDEHAGVFPRQSGIGAFEDCVAAIQLGDQLALTYGTTVEYVAKLTKGAERQFGYGEIATANDNIIRIDPFLSEQAKAVISPKSLRASDSEERWFKGAAHGSFVGTIDVVDVRGALPQIKLTLSAGGKLIDCVCHSDDIEQIKLGLSRRVRITGRAIYNGKSGLPRRVEVNDIKIMQEPGDFERWKGAFTPFTASQWDGDDA